MRGRQPCVSFGAENCRFMAKCHELYLSLYHFCYFHSKGGIRHFRGKVECLDPSSSQSRGTSRSLKLSIYDFWNSRFPYFSLKRFRKTRFTRTYQSKDASRVFVGIRAGIVVLFLGHNQIPLQTESSSVPSLIELN